jgi:hypothetical protein
VVKFGRPGDIPVIGDWNGNGVHTIGVVRGNRWLLRNSNRAGNPDYDFTFGQAGDIPVVGDWNGERPQLDRDGSRQSLAAAQLLVQRQPHYDFTFGSGDGQPVTGDWNGDGSTGVGWFESGTWNIRSQLSSGSPDSTFSFGDPNGIALTWGRNA